MVEIICKKCGKTKPEIDFPLNRTNGKQYRKTTCTACDNKDRINRKLTPPVRTEQFKKRVNEASSRWRYKPENRASVIVTDSRGSDRVRGMSCDLDVEWVKELISKGCSYCGETQILIGLDRLDNSIGHLKSNVVPACGRCNYLRRDMPYKAWETIVPAIKEAREKGLFKGWDGFGRNRTRGVLDKVSKSA